MAEQYTTWIGIVAFEFNPEKDTRTVSGKVIRKYTINVDGYEFPCQVDLWPDFDSLTLNKGDLIVAGGKATTWDRVMENGEQKSTWQMQPYSVAKLDAVKSTPPSAKQQGSGEIPGVKRKTF